MASCDLGKEERKITMQIEKAARRLKCLEDIKDRIEKLMQRYLQETADLEKRICRTEQYIEILLKAQSTAANQRKIREEIIDLRDQKKEAECCVLKIKKELYMKLRKLEQTRKKMPKIKENCD